MDPSVCLSGALPIITDDYAKFDGPSRYDFCVVYTMSLFALELKQTSLNLQFDVLQF